MTDSNINGTEQTEPTTSNGLQVSDIIGWTMCHKTFIAVSVAVCLLLGMIYVARTQQVYSRNASVMLRSDQSGKAQISELAAFADLGISSAGIDVYNELQAFQSPLLMEDVVNRLRLNVNYTSTNWIGYITDWYDQTPITADFKGLPETIGDDKLASVSFLVKNLGGKSISVSQLRINGRKADFNEKTVKVGQPFTSPVGNIVIQPTKLFAKNFNEDITVSYVTPEKAAKDCLASLKVELADKNATVINFHFTAPSAKRAEDVLNTLLDAYNEEWTRYTNKSTENTAKFINDRLVAIEQELGSVDDNIAQFKSTNKLLDIQAETEQVTGESSRYAEQAFLAQNQLAVARYIREYLVDNTRTNELLPSNSGIGSNAIEEQIAEYNKTLLERQRMVSGSSDSNPVVADYNNRLRMMRSTILRSIDNHISTLKIQADRLAAQESAIRDRITAGPGKAKELLSIERQQKIKEELYLYLLQKREENELQASIVVNNTRLLMDATGDDVPVAPRKSIILAVAFILGLAIPYVYMYLMATYNTKVRTRKDLEDMVTPLLGDVPATSNAQRVTMMKQLLNRNKKDVLPEIVVKNHNRNEINEAFRVIRTNLDFMIGGKLPQVIMLTSFYPGSGKTFTTLNLATVTALKDKRVMVIDLDIRKSTLSNVVNSPRRGIVGYLNGQNALDDIIVPASANNLMFDTIPTGENAPNPAELLLDPRMGELIDQLRQRYDYIFIDCPPMLAVTDAQLIAPHADRTVIVVRAGLMDRRTLPEIDKIYNEARYKNVCVLLNGTDASGNTNYGYGYGYGYGYEYGNNK